MNTRVKIASAIFILSAFASVFSDFPHPHSIKVISSIYGFSYSEDFSDEPSWVIGKRSDEYGSTFGMKTGYEYFNLNNQITFGINLNFARSINHSYDGSLMLPVEIEGYYVHLPIIMDTDNFFYGADAKIGYFMFNHNRRAIFEPKLAAQFNYWYRAVGSGSLEHHYCWLRILPGISLTTKTERNSGFVSDVSLSIPVWQKMYMPWTGQRYEFDIGGKLGWQFETGFVRYLQNNRTLKLTFFYENYGFKESSPIPINSGGLTGKFSEPSSNTHNHGLKFYLIRGFGG